MKSFFKENALIIIIIAAIIIRIVGGMIVLNEIPKTFGWNTIAKNVINGEKTLLTYKYIVDNGKESIVAHYYLIRPPLYLLLYIFLILFLKESLFFYLIIHSFISAASVFLAFQIFKRFLSKKVALMGAAFVAFYPHFVTRVWNATEDNLYILFILISMLLLFKYLDSKLNKYLVFSGFALGLTYLVRSTILFFVVLLIPIIFFCSAKKKLSRLLIFLFSFLIPLTPWLFYAYSLYGQFVLADYSGSKFWVANNKYIYSLYPKTSIDRIEKRMWNDLSYNDFLQLAGKSQLDREKFLFGKMKGFIRQEPWLFLRGGLKKAFSALSLRYNPESTAKNMTLRNIVHSVFYLPLLFFGTLGIIIYWKKYKIQSLIFAGYFISLLLMSFFLWAHTRHTIPYHLTLAFGFLLFLDHNRKDRSSTC